MLIWGALGAPPSLQKPPLHLFTGLGIHLLFLLKKLPVGWGTHLRSAGQCQPTGFADGNTETQRGEGGCPRLPHGLVARPELAQRARPPGPRCCQHPQ